MLLVSKSYYPARGLKHPNWELDSAPDMSFQILLPRKGTETLIYPPSDPAGASTGFQILLPRKGTETKKQCHQAHH